MLPADRLPLPARGARQRNRALLLVTLLLALPAYGQDRPSEEDEPEKAPSEVEEAPEPAAVPGVPRPGVEDLFIYSTGLGDQHLDEAISMTTFSTEELKSLRIQNIKDLADYTPSLEINTRTAASNPTLFIRGIGLKDYNANAASSVSIYQDGININAPAIQLLQLFDTQSVEVRRGPQGAGEGRNATAGAIFITSQLPTDEFELNASVSAGNYDLLEFEGAVNVPIIEDTLAARFAFVAKQREGTITNACAGWDPQTWPAFRDVPADQAVGTQGKAISYLITPETLRAEWLKDKQQGYNKTLNRNLYRILQTQDRGRQGFFGDPAQGNPQAIEIRTDDVCMVNPLGGGGIVTEQGSQVVGPDGNPAFGPEGSYFADPGIPQLLDFQGLERRVGDIDNWASRGILRWRPREDMDWVLNFHNFRNSGDSARFSMTGASAKPSTIGFNAAQEGGFSEASAAKLIGLEGTENAPGVDDNPLTGRKGVRGDDPFIGYYNLDGEESLKAWGSSLKGTWELGDALLTSLTGFETYRREIEDEGDANPQNVFPSIFEDEAYQLSQELRSEGSFGAWSWKFGAFLLYEYLTIDNLFPDVRQFEIRQEISQSLLSFAPYISARYDLTEELGVEGGFRLSVEQKDFTLKSSARGTQTTVDEIPKETIDETWTEPTGELMLTYAPLWSWLDTGQVDQLNFYVKGSRGFKGGHFNGAQSIDASVGIGPEVVATDPEFIWAAEAGIKSRLFDGRVTLTAAGFRYWYKDLQVFDIRNERGQLPTQQLLNGDARVWGAEVELDARPFEDPWLEGIRLQGGFSYLDTKFTNFEVEKFTQLGQRRGEGTIFGYGGHQLIAAPRRSLYGIVEWEFPLFGYGYLTPHWDFNYRSKIYLDPQETDPISQPSYWLHNASISYRTEEGLLEVTGWIDNLTDEWYKDDAFDVAREFNTILEVYNDPRTYGITISVSW